MSRHRNDLSAVLGARAQPVDVPVDRAEVCPASVRPPPRAERLDIGLTQRFDRGIHVVDVERWNGTRHEMIVVGFSWTEDLELRGVRQLEPREVVAQLADGQRDDVAEERHRLREPLGPNAGPYDPLHVHAASLGCGWESKVSRRSSPKRGSVAWARVRE